MGIYGYGFGKAGTHTAKLFTDQGLLLLEMDSLVELVLTMGAVVVALITGAAGALMAEKVRTRFHARRHHTARHTTSPRLHGHAPHVPHAGPRRVD